MSDKKIPKEKLDNLLLLCGGYYNSLDDESLSEMMRATKELETDIGVSMFALQDVVTGIIRSRGMKPDATNEDIYKVMEVLGWTVE